MGALAILGGRLNDRFGPRWVLSVSGLCFGLGYVLMYFLESPWQLYLFYGVLIGVGLSTHDVVTLSTVARWFEARRGIMTGVVKVGTACGQVVVPLVATALIAAFGWRMAFVSLGVGATVLLLIAAQGLRRHPGQVLHPGKTRNASAAEEKLSPAGLSYAEARRTRQFWTLCAVQFTFFPSLVTIPVHVAVHGADLGLSATRAAALLSTIGAASIAGRLTVGTLVDVVGGRNAQLVCFAVLLSSLLWLRLIEVPDLLFFFAAMYGFAHGGLFTVVSPTVAEFFGMHAHGEIFGTVVFFGTLGGAMGPILAGSIFDYTGSYQLAFSILAGLALIGLVLVISLRPLRVHQPA